MEEKKKNNNQQVISLILLIIIGIFIYGVIRDSKTKDRVYSIVDGVETTKDIYEKNEVVYCKDIEFSVTNVQSKNHKQDAGVTKGKKLVAVTYKIKNNREEEKKFYSSDFEVVSSNGEVKSPFLGVITSMWKGEFLKSPTLTAGGEKEGYLTYELNEDDSDYHIQIQCTISITFEKIYIKIKP